MYPLIYNANMLIVPQLISGLAAYATKKNEKKYNAELSIIGGLTFVVQAAENINNGHHRTMRLGALLIGPAIKTVVLMGIGNITGCLAYDCIN
jgi:hypothetical protein